MASFIHNNGAEFDGSEVVLVDLDPDRLELIRTLAEKMARARGVDLTITATTDRKAALRDCDAVLSSFRPGGFGARAKDERIPLNHGVIGQETQGPGGFFMALRAIADPEGHLRRDGGGLPGRVALQLHEPREPRGRGRDAPLADQVRLALRGADLLRRPDGGIRRARPGQALGDDGRAEPRLLERRAHLRRRGRDPAHRGGLGAAPRRPAALDDGTAHPAPRSVDGLDPRRVLHVLLLPRRDRERARRQAHDPGRGHHGLGARLLAPLRGAGAGATTRSSTPATRAAASTSSSSRST